MLILDLIFKNNLDINILFSLGMLQGYTFNVKYIKANLKWSVTMKTEYNLLKNLVLEAEGMRSMSLADMHFGASWTEPCSSGPRRVCLSSVQKDTWAAAAFGSLFLIHGK